MQINKENILKSIESFIGADNELAIKEAEHQIKVFEVVFQKEVESFQERGNEDEKNINPENEQENILILKAIQAFKKEQGDKKNKKKEEEKSNIKLKKEILENTVSPIVEVIDNDNINVFDQNNLICSF